MTTQLKERYVEFTILMALSRDKGKVIFLLKERLFSVCSPYNLILPIIQATET